VYDIRRLHLQTIVRLLAWAIGVIASLPLAAATLTIIARPRSGLVPPTQTVKIDVRPTDGSVAARELDVELQVPRELELPVGMYAVSVAGDTGFWATPRNVYVGQPANVVSLELHRAIVLRGRFKPLRRTRQPPEAATARVVIDDDQDPVETPCRLQGWSWQCEVPASTRHLSIKAVGYIARHWWDLHLTGDRDLGDVELKSGASFIGRVSLPRDRHKDLREVKIRLSRSSAASSRSPETKAEAAAVVRHPNEDGFFHFDGVPPGEYSVRASLSGLTSQARTVRISENLEAELRTPLLLEPPLTLDVAVTPARDANGESWSLELSREMETQNVVETVRYLRLSADGGASVRNLPAGRYHLTVRDGSQNAIARRAVVLPDDGTFVELSAGTYRLTGRLMFGERPLRATIWLGGEYGIPSVAVESGDDGRFEAVLPHDFLDVIPEVTVRADLPPVKTSLADVRVQERGDGEKALQIVLPDTAIFGRVVDESGAPVPDAMVDVTPASGGLIQIEVRQDGAFDLHGVSPGPVWISAAADRGRRSDSVKVTVGGDSGPTDPVVLVVRKARGFRGRVMSAGGAVAGAAVYVFPAHERGFAASRLGTDVDGTFEATIPPGSASVDVFISAPGFALTFVRRTVSEEIVDLPVTQAAAELVVEFERSAEDVAMNRWPTVAHGGATRELAMLLAVDARASELTSERSWKIRFPEIEPGDYTFCRASSCTAVSLAPYGTAAVTLP
jgi:hypothetical protein